jgi:hypothetical protein
MKGIYDRVWMVYARHGADGDMRLLTKQQPVERYRAEALASKTSREFPGTIYGVARLERVEEVRTRSRLETTWSDVEKNPRNFSAGEVVDPDD